MQDYKNRTRFGGNGFKCLERDKYKCVKCGMTNDDHNWKYMRDLPVDHINCDKNNHDLSNLQTLCVVCHGRKDAHRHSNVRGVKVGSSKLNDEKVREIRIMYATGKYTLVEIGKKYGVYDTAVGKVVHRTGWKHVK